MKKINNYILILFFSVVLTTACHDIDVIPNSLYTEDVFPETEDQFQSILGPVYTSLRGHIPLTYFFVTEGTTDAAILPAFGGNWYDGAGYAELHWHTWTRDHNWISTAWNDATGLVGLCNQTLFILENAQDGAMKDRSIADVKAIRAFAFWELMDLFGNVPLDTIYPSPGLQTNTPRAEMFSFIEGELKGLIPRLSSDVDVSTYGKPTQFYAYALLAKMYLNAEVYTGVSRVNDAIAMCDHIIESGHYQIENKDAYLAMFYPNNGPSQKEFIFAIPYDVSTSNGHLYHARYDLNRNLGMKYRYSGGSIGSNVDPIINETTGGGLVNARPSGPRSTLSSFLAYFTQDDNDVRLGQWLYGPQYWDTGNPIMVRSTKGGYDQFYSGSDAEAEYIYPLVIDTAISLRQSATMFDVGNDEIAWNLGARNIKFFPDGTSTTRNQNNDIPLFRYSDIVLMKAEAILRGGVPTLGHTALSLVNSLRSERTNSPAWTSVDLQKLYEERSREMSWECWHRNDMIRFGKYEDSYGFKTNKDTYRRIFPIPTVAMNVNSLLVQNPGYE